MKILLYIFLMKIRQVLFLSFLMFAPIVLLQAVFTHQATSQDIIASFAFVTGFLCILVTASTLQLEDTATIEMPTSLPLPYWQTTLLTVVLSWMMVWLVSELAAFTIMLIREQNTPTLLMVIGIGFIAVILFFGGITLLGATAGRDSRIGSILGLLVVAWMLAFPGIISRVPAVPAMPVFNINAGIDDLGPWLASRLFYSLIGAGCWVTGIHRLRDTDYLLVGKTQRGAKSIPINDHLKQRRTQQLQWLSVLSNPLSISASRNFGLIAYEGIIAIIKGPVSIAIAALWIIFGWGTILLDLWKADYGTALEDGAISIPLTLCLFLAVFLPFTLVATVSADPRTRVDQIMLSLLSPRAYLGGKLLGIGIGISATFLLCSLPASLFMATSILSGDTLYFTGYIMNLLLGVFPFLVYIIAISVLAGMLVRFIHPLIGGGLVAISILAMFYNTAHSIIGSILLPFGNLVFSNVSYHLYVYKDTSGGFGAPLNPDDFLLVPVLYLTLPLLSALVQTILMWLIASKIYERQVTSA